MKKIYCIAIEATLDVIGGKWKPLILARLLERPMRTSELKRAIPKISQRVLVNQLRELEEDQIVTRKIFNQVPPKVEYSLTSKGRSLQNVLIAMSKWGEAQSKDSTQNIEIINSQINFH